MTKQSNKEDEDSEDSPFIDIDEDEKQSQQHNKKEGVVETTPTRKAMSGSSSSSSSNSPPTKSVSFHQDSLPGGGEGEEVNSDDDRKKKSKQPSSTKSLVTTSTSSSTIKVLQLLRSRLDKFLAFYIKFSSSSSNQDKGLSLLQWTLWLFSKVCKNAAAAGSSGVASRKLTLNTTLILGSISQVLYKLSGDISFVRYALRLYGWPCSLEAIRTDSWGKFSGSSVVGSSSSSTSTSNKRILNYISYLGRIMSLSMLCYYPLEHIAYIKWMTPNNSKKIPFFNTVNANKYSAYSCRAWFVYIISDIIQCTLKLKLLYKDKKELQQQQQQLASTNNNDDDNNDNDNNNIVMIDNNIYNQQIQITRSLLFVLPCIHWSLPNWDTKPWLSENVTNSIMWIESLISIYQGIRNTIA